jgi:DNA-binding response OmpR family regulator
MCLWSQTQRESFANTPASFAKGLRVLVLDDERDTADSLGAVVRLFGHEARVAYSGAAGLLLAREFGPDVILCDIGMPGMDGNAFARTLRSEAANAEVLLIAISGFTLEAQQRRSLEAGFDWYFVKPMNLDHLRALLEQVIHSRHCSR